MRSTKSLLFGLWLLLVQSSSFFTAALPRRPLSGAVGSGGAERHLSERGAAGLVVAAAAAAGGGGSDRAAVSLSPSDRVRRGLGTVRRFCNKYFFLVGMVVSVALARAWPALGANGGALRPELLVGRFGVALIFFLSGLSLELAQLTRALADVRLNLLVQTVTFAVWPFLVGLPLARALTAGNVLPQPLVDGVLILLTLPTTVNMCVILTTTAGGSVATALCNAVLSNLLGILLTPALLFRFFGSHITLPFFDMLLKLSNKVLLPVALGQALRATPVRTFCDAHAGTFKRLQEVVLLSILWNAFCNAFSESMGLELAHALRLLLLLPTLHAASLLGLLALFARLPRLSRGEAVAAAFVASQKTLAFGLPLVNTIFEGSPNLAAYCAPIMFIHPSQLVIGSLLVPRLQRYIGEGKATKKK